MLADALTAAPNATAIKILNPTEHSPLPTTFTFTELDRAIRAIAAGLLNEGIRPGEVLLLRLPSDTAYALGFFGAIAAGIIPVPLSPQLTAEELRYFINDTGARWAIHNPDATGDKKPLPFPKDITLSLIDEPSLLSFISTAPLADYAATRADDPAFLIYTSGTTSKPKGVLHAQRTILGRRPMSKGWHQIRQGDKVLHAGDFNWTYTLGCGLMDPWAASATACLYAGNKPPTLWPKLIAEHEISIFAAVPGVFRRILKYSDADKSAYKTLRHCLTAGEALSPRLESRWIEKTGARLYEALGQSEISTYASTAPGLAPPAGAKGRIQPGRRLAILPEDATPEEPAATKRSPATPLPPNAEGLIAIHKSDPGLMLGYWQNAAPRSLPLTGDWFITGDRGTIDEDDYLTHLGRADDIMNASGYRVAPFEVEAALLNAPDVSEAAVFEKPVSDDLSIISAMIVPRRSASTKPAEELIGPIEAHMKAHLAAYKCPREYLIVQHLPRTKSGKLHRAGLKDHLPTS